ncbi:MAG: phosphotransferase family protein [Myxococcota bacterium]
MSIENTTRSVREGEEIDVAALEAFLASTWRREVGHVAVTQFPGGYSNLTYLVRVDDAAYVLRRPPHGSTVKHAHDMGREVRVLSALSAHRRWAPRPVVHCDDASVLGAEFYLMEKVDGVIIRRDPPPNLEPELAQRLCVSLLDTLVALHALDPTAVGLGDLGRPDGYVERQVRGWSARYEQAATEAIDDMDRVGAWLRTEAPPSNPGAIVHNDYRFDNVVYDSPSFERVVGVLDWEMATCGDPLMDLGTMLAYWVEAGDDPGLLALRIGPTHEPGMATRKELAARYAEQTGRDVTQIVFYYAFGLFKTAVVFQQIYLRYQQGLTRDPRFAGLLMGVKTLAAQARRAIDAARISF